MVNNRETLSALWKCRLAMHHCKVQDLDAMNATFLLEIIFWGETTCNHWLDSYMVSAWHYVHVLCSNLWYHISSREQENMIARPDWVFICCYRQLMHETYWLRFYTYTAMELYHARVLDIDSCANLWQRFHRILTSTVRSILNAQIELCMAESLCLYSSNTGALTNAWVTTLYLHAHDLESDHSAQAMQHRSNRFGQAEPWSMQCYSSHCKA